MGLLEDIKVCAKTDIGLKHRNNQDSFLIIGHANKDYDTEFFGLLFAVADGMSGHAAGGKASSMACKGLLECYNKNKTFTDWSSNSESRLRLLERVIRDADKEIYKHAEKNKGLHGMGTTLSVIVLKDDIALIAHVGDSRIYRLRAISLNS